MGAHKPETRKDPYVGYEPRAVAAAASACLACGDSAPCMLACSQQVDIRSIVELAGKAACEALALPRWFRSREDVESARLTDLICDSYNS